MIRDGAERIRHRGPDVAPAVAVEVDRVFVEARRQKLRLAHRAGPGRAHGGERDVAFLQHLEREQKLLAELLLAPAEIGLRRERADRAVRHLRGAVVRSRAPRSPARSAPGTPKRCSICASVARCCSRELAPLRGEPVERGLLQILRGRLHELRLRGLAVRPAGDHEIGQRQVRLEAARRRIEGRARDAELLRSRPQRLEEPVERRIGKRRRRWKEDASREQNAGHRTHDGASSATSWRLHKILADLLHIGDADRRQNEDDVDDGLPHHALDVYCEVSLPSAPA